MLVQGILFQEVTLFFIRSRCVVHCYATAYQKCWQIQSSMCNSTTTPSNPHHIFYVPLCCAKPSNSLSISLHIKQEIIVYQFLPTDSADNYCQTKRSYCISVPSYRFSRYLSPNKKKLGIIEVYTCNSIRYITNTNSQIP